MNEQAINDLYNLAKQNGYTKSLDEFVNLMYTNDNAFNDMYSLAQNNGYQKSQDDFSILIGKKKSEVAPSAQPQPKEEAQPMAQQPQAATELPSEGTSSESQLPKSNVIGEPFKGFTPEQAKTAFQPESAQKAFTLSQAQKEELGYQIPQSQTDFQKSMGQVNKELMDYDEEHIVPQLNYAFSNYGFHFNETGAGDYVEAVAPNGKRITIPVDNWTEKGDIQSSNELKAFIEQNKPKIAKLTSQYENYEKKFNTQKEVDNTIKNLHTEADSLNQAQKQAAADKIEVDKQAKELESVPMNQRNTPEYISRSKELAAKRSEVDARINKISQDEKTLPIKEQKLNKAIGQYTAAKAQQGGLFRAAYNTILDEIGSATAGIEDLNVRLAANVYSKIKGIQYALETGSLAPLSAPAQEAIAAEAYGVGKEKIIPTIKAAPKEAIGAQGVTEEYLKGVNEDFIKRNVLGVAGMVPMIAGTMVAPEAAGPIAAGWFFTTTYDHSLEQMDKNPAFKDVSDAEKGGVAAALGVVNATIASKGVTHILGNSGVMSSIINNTLGKLGVETTAKTLSEAVANDIENKVAKGVITTAASAATGALTGAELKGSELLLENTYNIIKDKKMFQTPDTFSGYLDEIGQSAADMAVGGVMLSVPNIISSAYSKSNFDGVTDEKLAFFDAMASDPITKAAYAANLKNEILSGKITVEQAKNHMDNLNNSIAIYQKVPKDLTPAATRKAMGLMVERNNLQLEVDSHDAAMTKKQRERIAEINSELEKVSEMKEKPAEAPAVPAEEVKPEGVPQEIASLADDENVVMTVKTLDEVPEEFKDRAKKVEGLEVTYRKKIFGLPIGEKTTEKVGEGYRYTLTGKEAKDYAIQKSSTEEGVLRAEQPELGLPKVGEGDQGQITTEEGVKPKAAGVEEEVSRLEEAFGTAFAEEEQMLPASVDATVLEAVPAERKMEVTFTQEDGTVSPLNGNEKMVSDLYEKAVAIPEAERTPAQQSVVDAVKVSLKTPEPSGVSVSNKEQIAALDTKTTDVKKKGIIRAAATAIKTLKSIFPDMDIVIHDNKGSYEAQMDKLNGRKGSAGNFSVFRDAESGKIVGGRVDINLERANMRTVAHEVAHAVMLKAFGDNPALFGVFRDRISKMLSEERNKELNDFADQYSKSESPEEFLVELSAALTEAQEQLSPTTVQRIAELINKVVSKITGGRVQPFSGTVQTKELIDFLNTMSSAIGKGEEIQVKEGEAKGAAGVVSKAQVASEVKEMDKTFTVSKSQVDAWHGSPHDFDKFTTEKMGTGEGAQAFGWGLYFTDLKSIAETYAKTLAQAKSNSQSIAQYIYGTSYTREQSDEIMKMPVEEQVKMIESSYQEKIKRINKKEDSPFKKELLSTQDKLKERLISEANQVKPVVYQVSIHQGKTPEQYTWLEWDKPVEKTTIDNISNAIKRDNIKSNIVAYNSSEKIVDAIKLASSFSNGGRRVYEILQTVFDSDKTASLFLLENGIDGIKYPAESIARGATSDTARGFNYVVFDENAVTIVSKAQKAANEIQKVIKDARAQGYSEEAIKAFLEKKGITDVDKLMEMPEAGKKVELGEELMKGYDKMMADVDAIIERGLNRNAKQETILANVLKKVRESDAYKNGTDIQKEQIEREVKQAFGEKMKTAPSVGKILGTIKDVTKITMSEKNLLKNQIKDLARGAKDAKKAIETATKTITESMAKLVKKGSISPAQQKTIIKRFGDLKVLSEKSVTRFVDYMTKVFADAEYDDKLKDAYTTKKNISKLSKNTEKNAHLRDLAKRFSEIDPSMVDNIDVYNALASNIKDAVKGSTFRGEKLNEAQTVSIKRANEYIKDALEKQNKKLYEEKLAEVQEMMGVDASDLSYEQLSELIRSGKPITKYNESILRTAINKMFDVYSTVVNDMFDKSKDPFTGEDITIDANKKDLVKRFMDMDLNKLEPRQALDAVDSLTNFIQNGSTAKMETVVAEYTANENMAELERRNVKGIQLKAYNSGQVGRLFGEYLMSLPLLMERVFRDYKTSSLVQKMSGLTEVINKKAKAVAKANAITNEYISKFYKEKANGEDFNTAYNATERGLAAFMTRNVIGDAKEQQVEFDVRKKFIEESIDALSKGTDKEKEKGELYQEAYDKVLKDSNNADDVRSKTDAKNLEAVDYWVSKWAEIYDQLSDVSENVYNTLLEKHVNYSPDRYTFFERVKDKTELGDNDSAFHFNLNSLYKKKTGVLREVRRKEAGDTLPRQEGKKKPSMYVDLSFDVNNANSMHDALVDIETAAGVRQVQEFINNESFEDIIGNAEDANLLKKRIQLFVRNMRGKSIVDADSLTKFSKRLETMASIGVGQALGGVTQPFKQTIPVAINTLINSGGIGLKVIANKSINDFIDNSGYGIANRGFGSTTELSSINKLIDLASKSKGEKAMQLIEEANKKWLKIFLVNPDVGIARASWISYYEKSLREQGIDTKDIDYSRHELNKEAADYAQRMVDRQQNISDHDLAGKLFVTKDGMSKIVSKVAMPFASFRINQFMRMTTDLGVLMNGAASKEDRFNAARSLGGFSAEMAAFKMISAGSLILMGTLTKAAMGKDEDDDEYKKRVNSAIKTQATSTVTDVLSPIPIADRAVQGVMSTALEKVQDFMNIDDEKKVSIYDGSKTTLASSLGTLGIASDRLSQLIELVKLSQTGKFTDDYGNEKEISDEDKEALKAMIGLSVLSNIGLAPTEVATIVRNSIKYAKQAKKTKNSSENEADKPPYGLTMSQYKRYFPEEYEKKYGEGSLYYEKSKLKNEISEQKEDMKRKILDERYDYVPKEKSKEGFGSNEFGKKKSGKKESSKKSGFGSSKFGKGD